MFILSCSLECVVTMSSLSDYFSKTYIDNIPGHNEVFFKNKIFLDNNPIQGYVHSIKIPLDYRYYEYLLNNLMENNKLMENQRFSIAVNKPCTNIRTVRFDGNASDLQESTVYENFKIEDTSMVFTLDFCNVSYTIDKVNRSLEKYNIKKESFSNTDYQNLAAGQWMSQDGGFLYVGCQQVLKDFTKILSKNERLINGTDAHIPAKKFRQYTDMEYIEKLSKREVETCPFLMFQIALKSSNYFTIQDINSFVKKYSPAMETQQLNNIFV